MLKDKERLDSSAYTPEEKNAMIEALVAQGCTRGTAYNRLFRDGFIHWQLVGIRCLMTAYRDALDLPAVADRDFYLLLPSREEFKTFMEHQGMCRVTTMRRFKEWDFKPWELQGVNNLLPTVCQDPRT